MKQAIKAEEQRIEDEAKAEKAANAKKFKQRVEEDQKQADEEEKKLKADKDALNKQLEDLKAQEK